MSASRRPCARPGPTPSWSRACCACGATSRCAPCHSSAGFYGAGFRGYYGNAYGPAYTDVSTYDVLTIETTLWDIGKDKPMWSGTSEVTAPKNVTAATEELAGVLIKKMKADGVI
jgi:hypothetical protein